MSQILDRAQQKKLSPPGAYPSKGGKKMRIKTITNQIRRDFWAVYECEHCGHERNGNGYDDANFHENVIPKMKCEKCGKEADGTYSPRKTRYPEGMQV
jgi:ribosomal protein L37AE/L43A